VKILREKSYHKGGMVFVQVKKISALREKLGLVRNPYDCILTQKRVQTVI
jgi:hypothetical protein